MTKEMKQKRCKRNKQRRIFDGKRGLSLLLVTVMVMTLGGCGLFPKEEESLAPPLSAPTEVTYTTTKAEIGEIEDSLRVTGQFVATTTQDLSFGNQGGYLSELNVKAGDTVTKGQILARLNSTDLELQIAQQEISLERARISYDMAVESSGADSYAARLAELDLQSIQMNLDYNKEKLEKLTIYAPMDGVVSYVAGNNVGEYIGSNVSVIRIMDPSTLQIKCINEKVTEFVVGNEVVVTFQNVEYKGRVVMNSLDKPEDIQDEGTFIYVKVEEEMPYEGHELLGNTLSVRLVRQKKTDVVLVPRNTVTVYGEDYYLYVLENGIRKERIVEVGIMTSTAVEIIKGVEAGEDIIIK